MSILSMRLVCDFCIVATGRQMPAVRFVFCLCFIRVGFVICSCLSDEPKQNQGRGLVDRKQVQAPSNFIAGHPKAALLFCCLVILDVLCYYLLLILSYIGIGKINVLC